MNIAVEYKDLSGNINTCSYYLTRIAFAKHMAFSGQGYAPLPHKLMRIIGMFIHYSHYLRRHEFYSNRFSVPPNPLYDPTEKGQFSNIAGKAIADFLSKKINDSLITVNYEAAMKLRSMPIKGTRPDLIAYSQNSMFAIEAKGYSNGCGNMSKHKEQSTTGKIPVNFTVACVSHYMYNRITCKYYDPYNEDVPFDYDTFKQLSKQYYSGLAGFLNRDFFEYRTIEVNSEKFYAINISYDFFSNFFPFYRIFVHDLLNLYQLQIILPVNIKELARNGISTDTEPFRFDMDQYNIYIDNDRVGLKFKGECW